MQERCGCLLLPCICLPTIKPGGPILVTPRASGLHIAALTWQLACRLDQEVSERLATRDNMEQLSERMHAWRERYIVDILVCNLLQQHLRHTQLCGMAWLAYVDVPMQQ